MEKATPLSIKYKNKWALSVFSKQQFPQMINFLILDPGGLFKDYDLLNVGALSWHIQEMWPLSLIHWLRKFGLEWQIRVTRDIVWKHLRSSLRYPTPPGVLINEISQMKNVSSQMVFNWISRFIHLTYVVAINYQLLTAWIIVSEFEKRNTKFPKFKRFKYTILIVNPVFDNRIDWKS